MGEVKRNLQKLINYHTSGETSMPSGSNVHYGEIVVRHNETKPELLIKVGEDKFATFVDVKAVETQVKNSADAFDLKINGVSASVIADFATIAKVNAVSGNIESTLNAVKTALEGADSAIATELSAVSATVVANKETYDEYVEQNDKDIAALGAASAAVQTSVSTLSGVTEVEVARLDGRVDGAFTSAVTVSKEYTNVQLSAVTEDLQGQIDDADSAIAALGTASAAVKTSVSELSAATHTALTGLSAGTVAEVARLDGRVDGAFTSAVTVSKEYTDKKFNEDFEPVKSAVEALTGTGDTSVTSIVASAVTALVDGADEKFDTLKEIADWILQGSGATAAELVTDIEGLKSADTVISGAVNAVSATVVANKETYDEYVAQNNKDIAALGAASAAVQTSVSTLSGVTEVEVARLDGRVDGAFTSAVTVASAYTDGQIAGVQGQIDTVKKRVDNLETLTATTQSAIQTATTNSGVKVEKNGTTLEFDFSEIVIDCGEF